MQNVINDRIFSPSRAYIEFCSDNFETIGRFIAAHDLLSVLHAATAVKVNANLTGLSELSTLAGNLVDRCMVADWQGVVEAYKQMRSSVEELAKNEPLAVPVFQPEQALSVPLNVKRGA